MNNMDRLYDSVGKKGHVCVGLDTSIDYIPLLERQKAGNDCDAVLNFNKALIDATYDVSACFKVQIAYYEEMGLSGLSVYSQTLKYIKSKGCLAIADIKRADISDTASRYAKAHFSGDFEADFVTLNPYMGLDSIEPWIKEAKASGKGAFVLMRTSNPGMRDFQYLRVVQDEDEEKTSNYLLNDRQNFDTIDPCCENPAQMRVYNTVGCKLAFLAEKNKCECGYGIFGAVVGCTERNEASEIRKIYPNLFFLIPGFGTQGGGAADAALLLRDGNGGVVNASRSIITAWQKEKNAENAGNKIASEAARREAIKMRDAILEAI